MTGAGHLVCVGVDGVQHPHLSFPPGDNIMTFLGNFFIHYTLFYKTFLTGCLESALQPAAYLSPPIKDASTHTSRFVIHCTLEYDVRVYLYENFFNYSILYTTLMKY